MKDSLEMKKCRYYFQKLDSKLGIYILNENLHQRYFASATGSVSLIELIKFR